MDQQTAQAILDSLGRIEGYLQVNGLSIAQLADYLVKGVTFILFLVLLDRLLRKGAMI